MSLAVNLCINCSFLHLLSVNIQGLIVPFMFHVLEHLTHNLILGINFLTHTKANIDMASRSVTFYDDDDDRDEDVCLVIVPCCRILCIF